ncbi:MAG TPA: nucleotide exchange factor GrpE [Gemmataceae bacterium]|nr:nucleotide exchange factor GrpE [Gemmataceae bacterium]
MPRPNGNSDPTKTMPPGADAGTQQAGDKLRDDQESLRARAEAAEQSRDEYLNLAQRTRADFENYQKRVQRDQAQERRYAEAPLALDLLPALDNLERATAAAKQAGETGPLVQGVAMVQSQLLDALRRHGITRIDAKGQPFDHNLHEAVMQQPSKDAPPGTVLQVLEHGYLIHDRLLRAAKVIVSS